MRRTAHIIDKFRQAAITGGAVNGGQIYGQYPKMKTQGSNIANANADAENLDIYGNGVLVPTLSADQYMQRLAQWFLKDSNASWNYLDVNNPNWSVILPNWSSLKSWSNNNNGGVTNLLAA